jgi:hypothetical protein
MEFRQSVSRAFGTCITVCLCWLTVSAQAFRLAPPQIRAAAYFFSDKTEVRLEFDLEGANIYYTLDGSRPSRQSQRYTRAINIRKNTHLNAIVVHPDYLDSEIAEADFIRLESGFQPDALQCSTPPDEKYNTGGIATLFDLKKGPKAFYQPGWLGFNAPQITLDISWKKARKIREIGLSYVIETPAWIFPPAALLAWGSMDGQNWQPLTNRSPVEPPLTQRTLRQTWTTAAFKPVKIKYLRLEIRSNGPLPDWHAGKGQPAWMFLDEIGLK